MKTLRERLNAIPDHGMGYGCNLMEIAKQMDALLEECAAVVESQARQDYGAQKLLAGFKPCEPDSAAIRLDDKLKQAGYSNDAD